LFYTNLSFLVLTIYFCFSVFISLREYLRTRQTHHQKLFIVAGDDDDDDDEEGNDNDDDENDSDIITETPLEKAEAAVLSWWMKLFWLLFQLSFTNALFLDLVFWLLLFNGDWSDPFNYLVHGFNFLFIVVELLLCSIPFTLSHVLFQILYQLAYGIIAFSWYGTSGQWVYPFLDVTSINALKFYPGMLVGSFSCFVAGLGLAKLRDKKGEALENQKYLYVDNL